MDAIALYKANIKNVVATMGVNLSRQHLHALEKLGAQVVLSLDSDEAGQSAMFKLIDSLKETKLRVRVTGVSKKGKDLDEIFNLFGEAGVKEFVNETFTINEFKLNYKLARTNLNNYLERSELIKYVAELASKEISDKIERENIIIMASKKIGCNKELISENIDNLKRKVVKSLHVVETKNNNNRYYMTEVEILKEMLFNRDATYYYVTNLGYMLDSINRSIATYIVDYYYKQLEWDGKKIIESIKEENIKEAALKIYSDDGIAKKFNRDVFDVLIKQRPLDMKIKELEEQFVNTNDGREKAKIKKEIAETKQILKGNKKLAKEDN
jgi:DNA primase